MYNTLVTNINTIDTSEFVLKSQYKHYKSVLKKKMVDASKKIPDGSGLIKKADNNTRITEIKGKIPTITDSATTAAFNLLRIRFLMSAI